MLSKYKHMDDALRKAHSSSPERHRQEATASQRKGDKESALKSLYQSLHALSDSNWPSARDYRRNLHCDISDILLDLKRPTDALNEADTCVEQDPTWPNGYYRRGAALLMLATWSGEEDQDHEARAEAGTAFRRCLQLNKESAEAMEGLDRIKQA